MAGALPSLLQRVADAVAPLAALAALLALAVPSRAVADRSDLLLAALVLVSALGIAPERLLALRARGRELAVLTVAPFVVLAAIAWALSRGFDAPVRGGVLALGLSSGEVATVGLVALAGGDAALALGAVTGSLVLAALAGPPLIAALGGGAAHGGGALLARFALVVLAPLAAGVAVRARAARVERAEGTLAALGTVIVAALVYAALSGLAGGGPLGSALLAAAAFLACSAPVGLAAARLHPADPAAAGLPSALRDFAVAAALAIRAFGPAAGTVAGLYGVLMLVGGAVAAGLVRRGGA